MSSRCRARVQAYFKFDKLSGILKTGYVLPGQSYLRGRPARKLAAEWLTFQSGCAGQSKNLSASRARQTPTR